MGELKQVNFHEKTFNKPLKDGLSSEKFMGDLLTLFRPRLNSHNDGFLGSSPNFHFLLNLL